MSITLDGFSVKRVAMGMATAASFSAAYLALPLLTWSSIGAAPAVAAPDYSGCTAGMMDVGISEADAIAACASARYPGNLGSCVVDVSELTPITADKALIVCGRSRRPLEVADCTINIHAAFFDSASATTLENCGRSLLPEQYGSCVVDIVDVTEAAVDTALTQCLRAGFQPWRIRPSEVF
ncbi:MAG: hypothetical protein AAF703_06210 [Cyanobacteria bacterium P01_D01_bin.105]